MTFFYRFAQFFSWLFFKSFHRLEVIGVNNIPSTGAFILASNHQSYFDPLPLAANCRAIYTILPPRFLVFLAAWSPYSQFKFHPCEPFPVGHRNFEAGVKGLEAGNPLLVFPEGTRSANGQIQSGKKGIGLLLAKSQCDVLPARIRGGNEVLGKGMMIPRIGRKLVVSYGSIIRFEDLDPGKSDPLRYETIANRVLEAISKI